MPEELKRYTLPDFLGGAEVRLRTTSFALARVSLVGDDDSTFFVPVAWLTPVTAERATPTPAYPPEPPLDVVVLDRAGDAWQRRGGDQRTWRQVTSLSSYDWVGLNRAWGPLTLLRAVSPVTLPARWEPSHWEPSHLVISTTGPPAMPRGMVQISLDSFTKRSLSPRRAREVADALLAAAAEVDGGLD